MQTVHIIGGSNSLRVTGWVNDFATVAPEIQATKLSIGAATSLMGLYRLLRDEVPDGGTVVWEYALNEQNHFRAGQTTDVLIYHLNWFLELCARRSVKVLPLVLWNRGEMERTNISPYRKALYACFERRGVEVLDMKPAIETLAGQEGRKVAHYYMDGLHYGNDSGATRLIAELVRDGLASASVPKLAPELSGKTLHLSVPEGTEPTPFRNSILTADLYSVDEGPNVPVSGRPLAAYLLSGAGGLPVRIETESGLIANCETRFEAGDNKLARIMKHLLLWRDMVSFPKPAKVVSVSRGDPGTAEVQATFGKGDPNATGEREALIGILVER